MPGSSLRLIFLPFDLVINCEFLQCFGGTLLIVGLGAAVVTFYS